MGECFYLVDVGNKSVHLGIADRERVLEHRKIPASPDGLDEKFSEVLSSLGAAGASGAIIASVVPALNPVLARICREHSSASPVFLTHETDTGVRLDYDDPSEVGADRIANAVAAVNLYGVPAVVVDFGTAITFDIVSGGGVYLGGVIAPGREMAAEALSEGTALLPGVAPGKPPNVIGKSTEEAIRSGIFYGVCGLVERVIRELKVQGLEGRIIFTGGASVALEEAIDYDITVNPILTLEGLRIIYSRIARA